MGRVAALSEAELEAAIYGTARRALRTPLPEPAWMDGELKNPGVTLQLLHVEYRERHPDGYGYTQFCEHYRRWKRTQRVVVRHVHHAGEKLFTDFAGLKVRVPETLSGVIPEILSGLRSEVRSDGQTIPRVDRRSVGGRFHLGGAGA